MCDIKRMEFDDLPDDVLLEVQRWLPPSDLKNSTLVKKQWRAVAEDPSLWEKFTVKVYSKEDIENLSIKRLRRIEEIGMNPVNWDAEDWNAFFRAVLGLPRLKKIDETFTHRHRGGAGVQLVDSSLFGRSLAKLEVVVLSGCTGDHIQELFSRMLVSTQIKKLELVTCRLSHLQPELFGNVLSRLEDLDLTFNGTTKHQVEALFTEILNKSSLKRLVLGEDSLRYVDTRLFAKALSKVEEVRFRNMVDDDQLEALLTELSFGTHQLKRLQLYGGDLSQMEPGLVAHVLSRLEELFLSFSHISDNQMQAIFMEMSHLTHLKKISFYGIFLSQVGAELLAKVLARLEDVDLWGTYVTADQMVEFLTEISRNSHLKALNIGNLYINLASVDPEILAKAVTQLEAVKLMNIRITRNQSISLFSEMSQTMQTKKINLDNIDLSSVEPEDFARALIRLEEVRLRWCKITHDQAMALFREMALNTQLKKLDLGVNVSRVDPEILASAITKVKEVILSDSFLSQDQIDAIFTCVLESENKLKKLDLRRGRIGAAAQLDPQIVRKVQEKLKGELKLDWVFITDGWKLSSICNRWTTLLVI